MTKTNYLFLGNPGTGKSTLINCIVGAHIFRAGVNYGGGLTSFFQRHEHNGNVYMDTPGLADRKLIEDAADAITYALRQSGRYKLFGDETVDEHRAEMYLYSRKGHLQRDDTVENIDKHYLSLHLVQKTSDEIFQHDWTAPTWSEREILLIRRKYSCDCKSFYQTGWLCAHVLAALKILDDFDLLLLIRSLPAWKPPGRPRKAPQTRQHENPDAGQYSIPRVVETLSKHPGSVIGWKVVIRNEEAGTARQKTGVIRPWMEEDGRYFWEIEFDLRVNEPATPDKKVDICELAEIINFTYRAKYPFI